LPARISPYNLDILSALFLSFNPNFVIFVRACFFLQRAPGRCIVKFTKDDSFTNGRFKRPEKSRGGGEQFSLMLERDTRRLSRIVRATSFHWVDGRLHQFSQMTDCLSTRTLFAQ
jgi:hypothetical protein